MTFTESEFAPNNVPLIPTQIYSSVLDFLHLESFLYLAKHKKADGQVAACYVIFTAWDDLSWNFSGEISFAEAWEAFLLHSSSEFSPAFSAQRCLCMCPGGLHTEKRNSHRNEEEIHHSVTSIFSRGAPMQEAGYENKEIQIQQEIPRSRRAGSADTARPE